jgi:Cu/Ag efflux protein CusF
MKYLISILLAVFSALPMLAMAQNAPAGVAVVEKEKGAVRGTKAIVVQGKITAIDQETRHVTIMGGGGQETTLVAGPQVKKFAQLKVGDIVTFKFLQSLALELKKGGTALRERVESTDSVRSEPGAAPAGGEAKTVHVTADVTAVNKKTGVVTLRGPQRTVELKVKDKTMLKDVAVGDQVEATFIEAVAISVSTPKAAKKAN